VLPEKDASRQKKKWPSGGERLAPFVLTQKGASAEKR